MKRLAACALAFTLPALCVLPEAVNAGPPFATDDPEPTSEGRFEIYLYSQGTLDRGFDGTALGVEVNYGALPGVQVSVAVPLEVDAARGEKAALSVAEVEAGIKVRFIAEDGTVPQVSFYPSFQAGHVFLPVWTQKNVEDWTIFGGGGLRLNTGREGHSSWFFGAGATRTLTDGVTVGAEIFGETAQGRDKARAGIDFGAVCEFTSSLSAVGSAGGLSDGSPIYYLALRRTI